MSWGDRTVGIILGLALGIAIVAVFVFVFSEDAVDNANLDHGSSARTSAPAKP